jgi:hypothetical protein
LGDRARRIRARIYLSRDRENGATCASGRFSAYALTLLEGAMGIDHGGVR